jgi:hypothetical protein
VREEHHAVALEEDHVEETLVAATNLVDVTVTLTNF